MGKNCQVTNNIWCVGVEGQWNQLEVCGNRVFPSAETFQRRQSGLIRTASAPRVYTKFNKALDYNQRNIKEK